MPIPPGDLSATNDPYTVAYAAILTALAAFPPWAAAVTPGNVIDLTTPSTGRSPAAAGPVGNQVQVRLVQADHEALIFEGNSTTWEPWQDYRLEVVTDALRLVQLNQVKFLTEVAIRRAGPSLTCDGLIRSVSVRGGGDDDTGKPVDPAAGGKRPRAWVSACTLRVQFTIGDSYLATVFPPT